MREYIMVSTGLWLGLFLTWYLVTMYDTADSAFTANTVPSLQLLMTASECEAQFGVLFSMADKLLKAGGPVVPDDLRKNIEHCISSDEGSRLKLKDNQLIRLFP
jgi:hypothetical protein